MTTSSTITIVGNITADPELRYLETGTALCNFSVAVNERYKDKSDQWQDNTSFIDCVAWRDLAENVAESLSKGDRVIVSGKIDQRTWETDDGSKRSKIELKVDDVGPSLRWATTVVNKIQKAVGPRESQVPAQVYDDADEPF
jgi:single-strand DNA-binding protein